MTTPKPVSPVEAWGIVGPDGGLHSLRFYHIDSERHAKADARFIGPGYSIVRLTIVDQSAGYAVVPVEPTEAMLEAALNESGARVFAVEAPRESGVPMDMDISEAEAEHFNNDIKDSYRDTYRAMLTASAPSLHPAGDMAEVLSRHPEPPRRPATAGLYESSARGLGPALDGSNSEPGSPTAPVPGSTYQRPPIEERLLYHREDQATGKMVLRNQDGPEAADTIARLRERVAELEKERDEARLLVTEANNSLYGSQGYFHSLNGGPFDKYHLSTGIEKLKALSNQRWAELSSLKAAGTRADGIEAAAKVAEEYDGEGLSPGAGYHAQLGDGFRTKLDIANAIRALSPASPKPVVGEIVEALRREKPLGLYGDIADWIASRFGKEGGT